MLVDREEATFLSFENHDTITGPDCQCRSDFVLTKDNIMRLK